MSNDTSDELMNALHHLGLARNLELQERPRYPRAAFRTDVLVPLAEAISAVERALVAADVPRPRRPGHRTRWRRKLQAARVQLTTES